MSDLKIALLGSAPSSVRLAPYGDPSWQIWGCSPGVYGVASRIDRWYELHLYEPGQPWFSPEYCQWMARGPFPVVMSQVRGEIPNSVRLPHEHLIAKYDPDEWFFTSSLAWMMAEAIEAGAKKIALYGVDMAANEEYEAQRAGCHYFTKIAEKLGIEVGVPLESDLFRPRFLYGVDEHTHAFRKARARQYELESRRVEAANLVAQKTAEMHFLLGAQDDLKYNRDTWPDKSTRVGPKRTIEPSISAESLRPGSVSYV